MKAAILTLPLHTNYGGILQAYALKTFLMSMGLDADLLDIQGKFPSPKWYVYMKRAMRKDEVFRERRLRKEFPIVSANLHSFISEHLQPRMVEGYDKIKPAEYQALVVGSDQVWRPRYVRKIEDYFLEFAQGWDLRRVAYAASFGTSHMEYSTEVLDKCSDLLRCFDSVSVREKKAVEMCSKWFSRADAVHVLDPVMLLDGEAYASLSSGKAAATGKVLTYILDQSVEKSGIADFISRVSGRPIHDVSTCPYDRSIPLNGRIVPSVEDWLDGFVSADFVVTDSFHGTVLAILMHKPFITVSNTLRGLDRMQSLLEEFSLDSRLVHGIDPDDDGAWLLAAPQWDEVDMLIKERRESSKNYLLNALF